MSAVYYNEIDPYCVQWLSNLMKAKLIPHGDIDTRSIEDVRPDELRGYTQCHFFAGLGGWAFALALAGWPDGRPVWTGSCPCQPFSAAGKRAGFTDERHLWPSWQHLIAQCDPSTIFGEQVASATDWLGLVCGDLENLGYAMGFNHIEAASAGADHRRDRLWFVADASSRRFSEPRERQVQQSRRTEIVSASDVGNVADAPCELPHGRRDIGKTRRGEHSNASAWVIGQDGKARRVEPSICLLAHGVPARVGKLRALGNAIDPRPAAAFISAYIEARGLAP